MSEPGTSNIACARLIAKRLFKWGYQVTRWEHSAALTLFTQCPFTPHQSTTLLMALSHMGLFGCQLSYELSYWCAALRKPAGLWGVLHAVWRTSQARRLVHMNKYHWPHWGRRHSVSYMHQRVTMAVLGIWASCWCLQSGVWYIYNAKHYILVRWYSILQLSHNLLQHAMFTWIIADSSTPGLRMCKV
jgi:hypothetical protein